MPILHYYALVRVTDFLTTDIVCLTAIIIIHQYVLHSVSTILFFL